MRCLLALLGLFLWPAAANAAWHEASSEHFVVYADQSEDDVRLFAEQLEQFHRALELVTGSDAPPPSPSNRVTIFVVDSTSVVRRLLGGDNWGVGGFYQARVTGTFAFVPEIEPGYRRASTGLRILLHEYAHHFQLSTLDIPVPGWLAEGAAEFVSAARFYKEGRIDLGLPDKLRMQWIVYGDNVHVKELLDPELVDRVESGPFYAKSWILYHYLSRGGQRDGQLEEYLRALGAGTEQLEAAEHAFGDLDQLDREVRYYRLRRNWDALTVQGLQIKQIELRRLSMGESEIMPWLMRSKRGVDEEEAAEVVAGVRDVAARYPNEPAVLSELAEAEYDAGNDEAAIAAADRALALDPDRANAYVQKGYALFRQAGKADAKEAAYAAALAPFLELNRRENDHPVPLAYYYRTFALQAKHPPEDAILALQQAFGLAPFDDELRMAVVRRHVGDRDYEAARATLLPFANSVHEGDFADKAKAALAAMARQPAPEPDEILGLLQDDEADDEGDNPK